MTGDIKIASFLFLILLKQRRLKFKMKQKTIQKTQFKVGELIIGTRIPYQYFIVQGSGESDFGYHPGAYDIALENAGGVQDYNHIVYSSILPKDAVRIQSPPKDYDHGAVLESITAEAGKGKINPKRLTAGLIITKVLKNGNYIGGLVAEYSGEGTREDCRKFLKLNMEGMVKRRFGSEAKTEDEFFIESIGPKSKYACALVMLGFVSYRVPVLEQE